MLKTISEAMEEPNGGGSSMRICLVPWFWMMTGLIAYVSARKLEYPPLEIILGVSAMLLGGKVMQRREEAKKEVPPTSV